MNDNNVDSGIAAQQNSIVLLQDSAEKIKATFTDVSRFQAGRALENMYPGENLVERAKSIAGDFDAHAGELAVSALGAKAIRSTTARSVLKQVRSYEMGPAQKSLDSFTGLVSSVNPNVLKRPLIKFIITWYNPFKVFLKSLEKVDKRLEEGRRNLEIERQKLVKNISNLDALEDDSNDQMKELLISAHVAELVTLREEIGLTRLQEEKGIDDLALPQRISNQQTLVARLNRRTLDLKAAAMRALLEVKVTDAGQKALVIVHDDMQFAVDVLYSQFETEVATAIILFQGKTAGEQSMALRTASANLAKSTGALLGEVTEIGAEYLTNADEDLRGLIELRNAVVTWSERTSEVAVLARQTRADAEVQLQEISKSLHSAARAISS